MHHEPQDLESCGSSVWGLHAPNDGAAYFFDVFLAFFAAFLLARFAAFFLAFSIASFLAFSSSFTPACLASTELVGSITSALDVEALEESADPAVAADAAAIIVELG